MRVELSGTRGSVNLEHRWTGCCLWQVLKEGEDSRKTESNRIVCWGQGKNSRHIRLRRNVSENKYSKKE